MYDQTVQSIISGNRQLSRFWRNSHGWAPAEAAELISQSRLDWQVELSESLCLWSSQSLNNGHLILAWTNLGALTEGTMKLFLSIYYRTYIDDPDNCRRRGETIEPDVLMLEQMRQFFQRKNLLSEWQISFIQTVQRRRNAIHAFQDRDIGTTTEYRECVSLYLDFMRDINNRIPYPDNIYKPRF